MTSRNTLSKQQQQEVIDASLPIHKRSISRAFEGTASPRQAIRASCLTCTGANVTGGEGKAEITNCRVYRCPLWAYRPYQDSRVKGEQDVETVA